MTAPPAAGLWNLPDGKAGEGVPARHPLAAFIAEALKEPVFAEQWFTATDRTFRPYAAATMCMGNVARHEEAKRQSFYRDIAKRNRRNFLSELASRQLPARYLNWLERTTWKMFSARDWEALIDIGAEGGADTLGHVDRITPVLVRQFSLIPPLLREPGFLTIVASLPIPVERWANWQEFIDEADANARALFSRMAQSAKSRGDVWDLYYRCQGRYWKSFDLPACLFGAALIEPIRSPGDMVRESALMENCLDKRISRVWSSSRLYFKGRDRLMVDCELVRRGESWIPGDVLGPSNQPVAGDIETMVRGELYLLARQLDEHPLSAPESNEDSYLLTLRNDVRNDLAPGDIHTVHGALHTIRGQSRSWTNGAYAIFEIPNRCYVQAMSSPDGTEYLVELSSHKYFREMNRRLTCTAIDFIERAGFVWPVGEANFHRWFSVANDAELQTLAESLLAIVTKVLGKITNRELRVTTHVPA